MGKVILFRRNRLRKEANKLSELKPGLFKDNTVADLLQTKNDWCEVRIDGQPPLTGWIEKKYTKPYTAKKIEQGSIEQVKFAELCYQFGRPENVNEPMLIAIAWAESSRLWIDGEISTEKPPVNSAIGAFQYTPAEWDALVTDQFRRWPQHADIGEPSWQIVVASRWLATAWRRVEDQNEKPTLLVLYLAHILGIDAALAFLVHAKNSPNHNIAEVLIAVAGSEEKSTAIVKRRADVWGSETNPKSVKQFVSERVAKLQEGLNKAKDLFVKTDIYKLLKETFPSDPETPPDGGIPDPSRERISGKGWELLVSRLREDDNGKKRRTVGAYHVFHDGQQVQGLSGMVCEPEGPGDNSKNGIKKKCLEAGTYPLFTANGKKYRTLNYDIPTINPGIEIIETEHRSDCIVHPGSGFLSSVGCLNPTFRLADASAGMGLSDSRKRTIALIEDMKKFVGEDFPKTMGKTIPRAFIVIADAGKIGNDDGSAFELALATIKGFESLHDLRADGFVHAYPDPKLGWQVPTIGFGTTRYLDGKKVQKGDKITEEDAQYIFRQTLLHKMLPPQKKIPYWNQMAKEQKAAILSFAYNLGAKFYGSDGFTTISDRLRRKLWDRVPEALALYNKSGGQFVQGLANRRKKEGELWLKGLA